MNLAPAATARSTCSVVKIVPAPISILGNSFLPNEIASFAQAVLNVISAIVIPPSFNPFNDEVTTGDEVTFSFEASNDKFAEDCQVIQINENTRLLRYAILYGYNASGKTNLLSVFSFLSQFWSYKPEDLDEGTGVIPFKLDHVSNTNLSCFDIIFYVGNVKYLYQLKLDSQSVHFEKLSYYKSIQPIMLFERIIKDGQSIVHFNSTHKDADVVSNAARDEINVKCLKNLSFFVARNQVNVSLPLIDAAKDWLRNNIMQTIKLFLCLMFQALRYHLNEA